jgi:hypothetical protein
LLNEPDQPDEPNKPEAFLAFPAFLASWHCSFAATSPYFGPGAKRAVVIPEYGEIDIEIIKNNMRTVGMSREQYLDLLSKV